jgi:hypothetical protein
LHPKAFPPGAQFPGYRWEGASNLSESFMRVHSLPILIGHNVNSMKTKIYNWLSDSVVTAKADSVRVSEKLIIESGETTWL